MSYESSRISELRLPQREQVVDVLLDVLLKHNGAAREFGSGDLEVSNEIADRLGLSEKQRTETMQTIVRKEGRIKKFPVWHRVLYRAASLAANKGFVSNPSKTALLTGRKEWMLTEKGIDLALKYVGIPIQQKESLPIKTYEVEKVRRKLEKAKRVENYNPIDGNKETKKVTSQSILRIRGFRQAVIEAYQNCCSVCGFKISSPDFSSWEVEAAHIVPHRNRGKDDIWNGLALCRIHHWAFDVGWFALQNDFTIEVSKRIVKLPAEQGKVLGQEILRNFSNASRKINLPEREAIYPHTNSIIWHRENVFFS